MSDFTPSLTAWCLLLVAGALLVVPDRPRIPTVEAPTATTRPVAGPRRRAAIGATGVAAAGLVSYPGFWWAVLPAAAITGLLLMRNSTDESPARRAANRSLIAVFAELLAACLDAGMAVGPALRAVGDVLTDANDDSADVRAAQQDGPLAVLRAVAAMLSLGADPGTAWQIADLDRDLAPIAASARRSAAGGAGLADAVREHAAALRRESATASARAAGRAGVLMTAPLGVCFLPAFLCLGLAPVVVGLLGQLDIF